MKITLEIWNSVDFKFLLEQKHKKTKKRLRTPDSIFRLFPEYKQFGIHRGTDSIGTYFGWPGTGYDCFAYRIKKEGFYV